MVILKNEFFILETILNTITVCNQVSRFNGASKHKTEVIFQKTVIGVGLNVEMCINKLQVMAAILQISRGAFCTRRHLLLLPKLAQQTDN